VTALGLFRRPRAVVSGGFHHGRLDMQADVQQRSGKPEEGGTTMKKMVAVLMGLMLLALLAGCATTKATQSGFLGDYYKDLAPGPQDGAKMRWVKPGADFAKYNKIMLDSVLFALANDAENKAIDPEVMKDLQEKCNLALVNAFKGKYPLVSEPGPDVARIRVAVTGIKPSSPGISAVTSVVPVGLAVSLAKKGSSGSYTGSGATNAELMALDSMSNEVLLVAQDEATAGFTERFSKYGSVEESFKYWGEKIVKFLDDAKSGTKAK
jgi:hypothetical protein